MAQAKNQKAAKMPALRKSADMRHELDAHVRARYGVSAGEFVERAKEGEPVAPDSPLTGYVLSFAGGRRS